MQPTAAELIRREIACDGPLPFDRFMDIALHDPEAGYYGAGRVRFGGDFITAPHISPLFAACLLNLVAAADAALGEPDPFYLIEGGPGEGTLAAHLLDLARQRHPALYRRLRYAADEASPALADRQARRLADHADRLAPVPVAPIEGLYLSNELVDAFPVRRAAWDGAVFRELLVASEGEDFVEVPGSPAAGELARALDAADLPRGEPYRLEVNLRAETWLLRVGALLRRGFAVTIDYGDEEASLYGPHRPDGTLRGFRDNRLVETPLAAPGEADITASVNFSALRRAGRGAGFGADRLLTQRDALFAWGISGELERAESLLGSEADAYALRQEIWPLLFGGVGMGEAFRALAQAKDAPLDALPLDPEKGLLPL